MKKGFTFAEVMVTLGVIAILAAVTTLSLFRTRNKADLDSATKKIAALLREAQSDSMAQSKGVSWGVHLENATTTPPFYALFASSTYGASTIVGYYPLPASVAYDTSTLNTGSSVNITFSQITGIASASTTIRLFSPAQSSLSSTISIASSGAVSY